VLAFLMLTACTSKIHAEFEEAKRYALEEAGEAPADWQSEAAIWLSDDLVERALVQLVNDQLSVKKELTLSGPLGTTARVTPTATIETIDLRPSDDCDDCLKVKIAADGAAAWELGKLSGQLDFQLDTTAALEVRTTQQGQRFALSAELIELKSLTARLGGDNGLDLDLSGTIAEWARDAIVGKVPEIPLVEIGGEDLPIRGLRLAAEEKAIRVDLLTDAAHGGPLTLQDADVPADGWQVKVSQQTLLDLARRAAFEHGEVSEDIWVEPKSLSVDRKTFTLGLRIWGLSGNGWWREYEVTGAVGAEGGSAVLTPEEVIEGEDSPGALVVDLLALLSRGKILEAISDAVNQSIPLPDEQKIGDFTLEVTLGTLNGSSDALAVVGTARLQGSGGSGGKTGGGKGSGGGGKGGDGRGGGGQGGKAGGKAGKAGEGQRR
jgi:hypothetical protein